jgi:hypothetical protein
MIVDARLATQCRTGRPYTSKAAVSNLLDDMLVGDSVDVDAFLAPDGSDLNKDRLAMIVHKLKGDRTFQVIAKYSNAGLATVRRIA